MVSTATTLALVTLLALPICAAAADGETVLALPHPLQSGESIWLEVEVGVIHRGQEIEVATTSGQAIGTISPFGIRAGQEAGTYVLPVPAGAVRDGRLSLRLRISQLEGPPRAPTPQEVKSLKLSVTRKP
jgi:hypothetical protein